MTTPTKRTRKSVSRGPGAASHPVRKAEVKRSRKSRKRKPATARSPAAGVVAVAEVKASEATEKSSSPPSRRRGVASDADRKRTIKRKPSKPSGTTASKKKRPGRKIASDADRKRPIKRKPSKPSKPSGTTASKKKRPGRKRKPSSHPEAVRSRRRRAEQRGVTDQLAAEREAKLARRRVTDRARRRGVPLDERRRAIRWLEWVREVVARVFRCSLDVTEPVSGTPRAEAHGDARRQHQNMGTPWLVVGRFDAQEEVGYLKLAEALDDVANDLLLEATVHPQRLSQVRVVYRDPRSRRGEGDSVVSKIGGWEFVLSDLVAEMVGSGPDDPDSLAVRYEETTIPKFYVYFSTEIIRYVTASPWQRVKLR